MSDDTKLLMICLAAGTFALVYSVTRVLGAWFDHHLVRHNLIVESKRRRLEYYAALAARDNPEVEIESNVEIVEDEAADDASNTAEEPVMAQAA